MFYLSPMRYSRLSRGFLAHFSFASALTKLPFILKEIRTVRSGYSFPAASRSTLSHQDQLFPRHGRLLLLLLLILIMLLDVSIVW